MAAVTVSCEGVVAVVELSRPESGNALAAALVGELTAAVLAAAGSGARALVLAGAGRHFCTGADLRELAALNEAGEAERLADATRLAAAYTALLRCPLPTVAAVHGAAYGGGLGLAAACDVVVAAPDVRLQFSEVRLGFVPALISVFLPRRVPAARLARLFLDPEPLDGAGGLAAGLVDEVDPAPRERAVARAAAIAGKASPSAIAETKKLLLATTLPSLDAHLALAARVNATQRAHPECRRGIAAVLSGAGFPTWTDEP
jgi:methylglutaconyl-CoA hydratase